MLVSLQLVPVPLGDGHPSTSSSSSSRPSRACCCQISLTTYSVWVECPENGKLIANPTNGGISRCAPAASGYFSGYSSSSAWSGRRSRRSGVPVGTSGSSGWPFLSSLPSAALTVAASARGYLSGSRSLDSSDGLTIRRIV